MTKGVTGSLSIRGMGTVLDCPCPQTDLGCLITGPRSGITAAAKLIGGQTTEVSDGRI
jgi:hypothetical protein